METEDLSGKRLTFNLQSNYKRNYTSLTVKQICNLCDIFFFVFVLQNK